MICDDKVYQRTSSNPKHAFAFKVVLSDQVAEAHVVVVLWSPSKNGYLKPRVKMRNFNEFQKKNNEKYQALSASQTQQYELGSFLYKDPKFYDRFTYTFHGPSNSIVASQRVNV